MCLPSLPSTVPARFAAQHSGQIQMATNDLFLRIKFENYFIFNKLHHSGTTSLTACFAVQPIQMTRTPKAIRCQAAFTQTYTEINI